MSALLDFRHIIWANPWFFCLLVLVPLMIWWRQRSKRSTNAAFRLTTLTGIASVKPSFRARMRPALFWLRVVAVVALVVALARPQSTSVTENIETEGIDIVLSMDISGSMLAQDFKPNRIEAAKSVAERFIDNRPTDRIGLVIFSSESYTLCPITINHTVLKEQLSEIKNGMIADGTSIGMGLATAVDRLRFATGKSKVVILMTDGVNNTGSIGPEDALEIAKAYHVRVYTIGIGTQGNAPMPAPGGGVQMMPVEIDEPLLRQVAAETGGKYYRATNNKTLENIYKEIDKLEKTKVEMSAERKYAELFYPFAALAIVCLALELLLRYTVFRSIT
jgi:Ca-activated chloride channel homolog